MRLIVGLGNPGDRYRDTLHNAGFRVCDHFADRHRLGAEARKFEGLFRRGRGLGLDLGTLKPQTYMNLSGDSVAEALRYLPLEVSDIVVVYDEMDLPAGKLRIRPRGGHGGHNGLRSVIASLGSDDFPRLRVGVGRPDGRRDPTSHLLARMKEDERRWFESTVALASDALDMILERGAAEAMNTFNGQGVPADTEKETKP